MPRIFDVEQHSDEWFELRRGVITATRAKDLFDLTKAGKPRAKHHEAVAEIAMERLDHSGKPRVTGAALRRGNDYEEEAIEAYMFQTGNLVEPCGFALHEKHGVFGCSPDGLVGTYGMAQIKVPTSVLKHVEHLQGGAYLEEYHWQLMHEMYVMDRAWTDIVSYNPESPPEFQLAIHTLEAPADWSEYELALKKADNAIEDKAKQLRELIKPKTEKAA